MIIYFTKIATQVLKKHCANKHTKHKHENTKKKYISGFRSFFIQSMIKERYKGVVNSLLSSALFYLVLLCKILSCFFLLAQHETSGEVLFIVERCYLSFSSYIDPCPFHTAAGRYRLLRCVNPSMCSTLIFLSLHAYR